MPMLGACSTSNIFLAFKEGSDVLILCGIILVVTINNCCLYMLGQCQVHGWGRMSSNNFEIFLKISKFIHICPLKIIFFVPFKNFSSYFDHFHFERQKDFFIFSPHFCRLVSVSV
jgi:hypothetical protein